MNASLENGGKGASGELDKGAGTLKKWGNCHSISQSSPKGNKPSGPPSDAPLRQGEMMSVSKAHEKAGPKHYRK